MTTRIENQNGKSVVRNAFYGSLTWFLPLGLSIIATPMIVRSLGNRDYGIYALVLGFIGYSFTFSFGRAITKYIAEYRTAGETDKIGDVISASFFVNLVVGIIGVMSITLLASWLVTSVFNIEPVEQEKTITAFYVSSVIIFFSMLNQLFSAVLLGIQRFDIYSKVFTANSFTLISGNLTLAYLGFSLLALLYWNLGVQLVFSAIYAIAAKRMLPEFGISMRFRGETLRLVLRYSAGIVSYQILANVLLLFERGWITQRLGSDSLTFYVVPMSLGMQLQAFITSLVLIVFPLASELKNDRGKLLRLYTKATKVISLIVVFIVVSVLIESRIFLRLWMGDDFAQLTSTLLVMHIICFGLISIMSIAWQMTEGLGYPQFNALTTGISTTIGVTLMLLLTNSYGNYGVAIARLSGFAVIFLSVFVVEKWFFKRVQVRFWMGLTGNLTVAAIAAALVEYIVTMLLPLGWPSFFVVVIIGCVSYGFTLWVIGFITTDEKLLIRRVLVG